MNITGMNNMYTQNAPWMAAVVFVSLALSACSGSSGDGSSATSTPTYEIGGNVAGLASGEQLVLHNNGGDPLTVNANGSFAFPARIKSGESYKITVGTEPTLQKCSVSNGQGAVNGANVTEVYVNCSNIVSALYPFNGVNWNDYVLNDGATAKSATDTACTGDEIGGYSSCIHGGERRVFHLPTATSCDGLAATDSLGVFDWFCDTSLNYVRFISKLHTDKRLADLIDFSVAAWKPNTLTVVSGVTTIATSASTPWWSNPIVVDNDGMTSTEMNTPGAIYLVTANTQGNYVMGADKVSLVIRPGVTLRKLSLDNIVSASGRKFIWIEGSVNAYGVEMGVGLTSVRFSVLRDMHVVNANTHGIQLSNSHYNQILRTSVSNNGTGIDLSTATSNTLVQVTAVGNSNGVSLASNSSNNVIQAVNASNNATLGLTLRGYAKANAVMGVAAGNNGADSTANGVGLYVYFADKNTISDMALANNYFDLYSANSSYNTYTGALMIEKTGAGCVVQQGANPGLVTGTCGNQGSSDASLTSGITLASAFVGKIAADDDINTSDTNGVAAHPGADSFDWSKFTNQFRAWGKEGSSFPNYDNSGRWTTGTGHIWDWSLSASSSAIRGTLPVPNGNDTITHAWLNGSTTTFLRHAIEIDGDSDGLCESNETCLYTPNIGAYQGHGPLVSAGIFTDGTITGVRLMRYENNGR